MSAVNSSPWIKAIGWGLLAGGLACVGIEVAMTWLQGDITAATETGKIVNKLSAVTIAVVGVVIVGFAAGACRADKKQGWARGLTIVMLLSAAASIYNMASFQATERMSASKSREAEIARAKVADDLGKQSAAKTLALAGRAKTTAAREDYMYGNQEAIRAFRDAKVQVHIEPDAGAQLWATLFKVSLDSVQMAWSAYVSILVIILAMVCLQGAGFFLNPLAWVKSGTVASSSKGGSGGDEGSGGKGEKQPEKIKQDEKVVPIRAEPASLHTPTVRSVELGASRSTASDRVREVIAQAHGQTSLQAIAAASRASLATVSRVTRDMEGKGKLKRSRKGREYQVARNHRMNGAHAPIFG